MEIKFSAHGDKEPIPEMKRGQFLKLIGPNGIGKTTAADFLEIAFGEYNFRDKGFENIKNAINDCNIKIKTSTEEFEITLTPGTWKYIDSEFRIEEDSIGTCLYNGKTVKPNELREFVSVKVIRGDEDLEKQIELVSSMFNVILKKKLKNTQNYLDVIEEYYENFKQETKQDLIKKYEKLQDNYAKTEKDHQKTKIEYEKIKKNVNANETLLDLINKIFIWEEYDPKKLEEALKKVNDNIEYYENKQRNLIIERKKLEVTLSSIDKKQKEDLNKIFSEIQKIQKKQNKITHNIKTDFPTEWQNIQKAIKNRYIEKYQEKKINRLKELQNLLDELEKGTAKLNETLITKFNLILKLLDECREEGLGDRDIIEIDLVGKDIKLSIEEFRSKLNERIDVLNSDPEIESLKIKRDKIGKLFIEGTKIKEILEDLNKTVKKENELKNKKAEITKKITLEKYVGPQLENYLRNIGKVIDNEGQVRNHIYQLKMEKSDLEEKLNKTKNLEPLNKLKEEVGKILSEQPSDYKNKIDEINEILAKDKENSLITKNKLDELTKELSELEQEIDNITRDIMKSASAFGYREFSKWMNYMERHIEVIKKISNDLENLRDVLEILNVRFSKIEKNEPLDKKDRDKILDLISDVYNQYFLNTYKDEEFFKYVFKGYKAIKQFDVINKIIIFVKENDKLDERKLKEFSSGEKAYAFIRAMILLSKKGSKSNILIVDEAYALMDYMRSGDLIDFQKELIQNGNYDKIINILPMRKDPEELDKDHFSEFDRLGYYHELIKV